MKVILKVDDFWAGHVDYYKDFFEVVDKLKVKISLGIVGSSMVNIKLETTKYLKQRAGVSIEPFNHSYNHLLAEEQKEFFKTDFDYQLASIVKTNKIIEEKIGVKTETIGFVANACDQTTINILKELPEIKNIYFIKGSYNYAGVKAIGKNLIDLNGYNYLEFHNIDGGRFVEFERFKSLFHEIRDKDCITFQMHPAHWSKEDLADFEKIIRFLLEDNKQFIFPSEL